MGYTTHDRYYNAHSRTLHTQKTAARCRSAASFARFQRAVVTDRSAYCRVTDKKLSYRRGTARCVVSVEVCQLPRNSAETTCTTSPGRIKVMKLKRYSKAMCSKHVHSTVTRASRFHCLIGVRNKPTTVELRISPVYRRLAVAKFSKSTM